MTLLPINDPVTHDDQRVIAPAAFEQLFF